MHDRWLYHTLMDNLENPYVLILFGARQVGKSTLLERCFPHPSLKLNLADPIDFSQYGLDPARFIAACQGLPSQKTAHQVVIDEIQALPSLINAVQSLYDSDKKRWKFILSGSSARKLRQLGANLLPGRCILVKLFGLTLFEHPPKLPPQKSFPTPPPFPVILTPSPPLKSPFPASSLMERLTYGDLPGVVVARSKDKANLLRSYTSIYLEEEVRREASLRNLSLFAKFLKLAALESGNELNLTNLSQQIGLSKPTIRTYYQILEEMFVGFQVEAFSGSSRKQLLSTSRFYFFDLGVRHAAAGLPIERSMVLGNPGPIFEQWVGLELWKRLQYQQTGKLTYYRTRGGVEIDFVVETHREIIPVEVKWTDGPRLSDIRHLTSFITEYSKQAYRGYLICRCDRPLQLSSQVTALPWWML